MGDQVMGCIAQGEGGWWVAQIGTDCIDAAVLRAACNESSLMRWDGVLGRYQTADEAQAALNEALEDAGKL